ncbi:hypothetical protein [Arcobacter peruensis]|uniref:hypothetical protein n=1 Tax=Arcobacter peruensis TaxID=2320140 RepID=UPI000F0892DB|nr:hypothetical protein [Arcobacter peruensis]
MIRGFLLLSIGASLFASSDYVPFSKFSKEKQVEYNFIKIEKNSNEKIPEVKKIKKTQIRNYKKANEANLIKKSQIRKQISQNTANIKNSEAIKEYKKENILNDNTKITNNTFIKDIKITPKLSYMHVSSSIEDEDTDKTHEIIPEISFTYKNHTLKADYFNVNRKLLNSFNYDTDWYRLIYLHKIENLNVGLGFNSLKLELSLLGISDKNSEKFPTFEFHMKNNRDRFLVEYGGFYGKNSDEIKSAYEYYLNLGYKIFNNDNLIFNLGYKNRTVDYDNTKLEFKGPTVGISTSF